MSHFPSEQVYLTATLGAFNVAATVDKVDVQGEGQSHMILSSPLLSALNRQLQFVTYTNTVFHPKTTDTGKQDLGLPRSSVSTSLPCFLTKIEAETGYLIAIKIDIVYRDDRFFTQDANGKECILSFLSTWKKNRTRMWTFDEALSVNVFEGMDNIWATNKKTRKGGAGQSSGKESSKNIRQNPRQNRNPKSAGFCYFGRVGTRYTITSQNFFRKSSHNRLTTRADKEF